MSNISGQLIKDSYNYVLQSDLISGIVYRIGGSIAENPKFVSGLTVNASFTYSDGSEFPGYVLTCDAAGNAVWSPVSGATSGVVVTGGTFDYSAGTLTLVLSNGVNVPISGLEDIYVTGGVVSGNSIVFSYNDTNTFQVTGITPYNLFSSYTASTQVTINNKLDVSGFTSYTASTQSTINNKLDVSGFTAYTATTQPLILNSVTGGTFSGGTLYLINNSGSTIPISGFTTGGTSTTDTFVTGFTLSANTITLSQNRIDSYSSFTISLSAYTGSSVSGEYLPLSGGTVTGGTNFTNGLTANTISATTYYNLPISAVTNGTGISASTSNGTVTIINTAPDQTVLISGGSNIQITGSYPSFGVNFTGNTSSTGDYLPLSGGTVTGGTIFQSGLTANTISATTYQNLPATPFLPLSGGTVSGATRFTGGLTANTISATTYQNLPATPFLPLTGGTVNGFVGVQPTQSITQKALSSISDNSSESIALYGLAVRGTNAYGVYCEVTPVNEFSTITNGIGGYFNVGDLASYGEPTNKYSLQLIDGTEGVGKVLTSVTSDGKANWSGTLNVSAVTATSISATTYFNLPTSSSFTGGTVSGATRFTGGLTANTISATTYQNLPSFTGGTVSGATRFTGGLTANTISATTYQNLPATPFLPFSGGTINGNLRVNGDVIISGLGSRAIQLTASDSFASYGVFSYVTRGINAYGVYGVASPDEFPASITNGIGGYFAADNSQGYENPTNRYSVQLVDGTEGLNKVLTCVTSDGKANWETPKTNGSNLYLFYNY